MEQIVFPQALGTMTRKKKKPQRKGTAVSNANDCFHVTQYNDCKIIPIKLCI